MPIVRIELFPGRDDAKNDEVAKAITATLAETAGIPPEATTVIFTEVRQTDWFVAGDSYASKAAAR